MKAIAQKYYESGLSVIPVDSHKRAIGAWKPSQSERIAPNGKFEQAKYIAIVGGAVSGGLECIDIDLKYDITGTLMDRYKALVNESEPNLLKRLLVEKSPTGGYHFIYRYHADSYAGNLKLANRYATEQEKQENPKEKIKVLLETRGEGGYFVCAPSDGYQLLQGNFNNIPVITETERNILIACACALNEISDEVETPRLPSKPKQSGLSTFEDFNQRGDILSVLIDCGWSITHENAKNYFLKRPGKTDSKWSATLHKETNTFYVFSSSTEFEPSKGYSPSSVYGILRHNKDWSAAAKDLAYQGFGEPINHVGTQKMAIVEPAQPKKPLSFLVDKAEIVDYINMVYSDTLPMGLETGIYELDIHYRFKRAHMNIFGGHDNVGKTVVLLFLLMQSARLHNWKWGIASLENNSGSIFRYLIEFYVGKSVKKMTEEEINKASKFVSRHFYIVSNSESYSYKGILEIAGELKREKNIDGFLVDPYNALELDAKDLKLYGDHNYHYMALTEFRKFTKKEDCCIYINCHAVTEALRRVWTKDTAPDKDLAGHPMPPKKSDVEQGGKFGNRADDFVIIHRYTQHETRYRITEIHVVKVKDTPTGGRTTQMNKPVRLEMAEGNCGFLEYETRFNPVTGKREMNFDETPYKSWNND